MNVLGGCPAFISSGCRTTLGFFAGGGMTAPVAKGTTPLLSSFALGVFSHACGTSGKDSACQCKRHRLNLWEDPLEKEVATHSSIPAWRIPWTEDPGRLQSTGLQRVRHN